MLDIYLHMICKSFDVMKEYFVFIIILRYDASKDKKKGKRIQNSHVHLFTFG